MDRELAVAPMVTMQDPAVPMIALPTRFRSRRQVTNVRPMRIDPRRAVASTSWTWPGPGAVRHVWLLYGTGRRLEITVDGAPVPQVDVPFDPFFGDHERPAALPGRLRRLHRAAQLPDTPGVPGVPGLQPVSADPVQPLVPDPAAPAASACERTRVDHGGLAAV